MSKSKYIGSSFRDYLLQDLKDDDDLVFLHIKNALEKNDIEYLLHAMVDVVAAHLAQDLRSAEETDREGSV